MACIDEIEGDGGSDSDDNETLVGFVEDQSSSAILVSLTMESIMAVGHLTGVNGHFDSNNVWLLKAAGFKAEQLCERVLIT